MKSLLIAVVFALSLAFAFADKVTEAAVAQKELNAINECNATFPVQENPRLKLALVVAAGEKAQFSQQDKCFLNCFLQKVDFFDENSNIRNGSGLVKFIIKQYPEIAKYSDVLIAQVFQIARSTKGFDDKCLKAFIVYHQFSQGVFILGLAEELQKSTGIKDKIVNAIETGQNVDQDTAEKVKKFLGMFDAWITSLAEEAKKEINKF